MFCTHGFSPRTTLATLRKSLEAKGAKVMVQNASPRSHPDRGATGLAEHICAPLKKSKRATIQVTFI